MNKLYYGDNLHVLRNSIAAASVELIYLDPPFNSKRDYNLLFKSPKVVATGAEGAYSAAQIEAFEDTWHWSPDVTERAVSTVEEANSRTRRTNFAFSYDVSSSTTC